MRNLALLLLPALAACGGEAIDHDDGHGYAAAERPAPGLSPSAVPVRVGELGASFPACNAVGTARRVDAGAPLAVRAAPFDSAERTGGVAAGSRFAICSRSHDQKWFGIVFDGGTGADCGVSQPVARRADYAGPCRSGWVSSALVRLVAGNGPAPAASE